MAPNAITIPHRGTGTGVDRLYLGRRHEFWLVVDDGRSGAEDHVSFAGHIKPWDDAGNRHGAVVGCACDVFTTSVDI